MLRRIKPWVRYLLLGLLTLAILFVWTLPLILEYYLEKNDIEWFGREMEVEDIDLNLFTGRLAIEETTLFEKGNADTFITINYLETEIKVYSLISSLFELEYVLIESPVVHVRQTGSSFNFDDLFELGGTDSSASEESETTRYIIHNIRLSDGKFTYEDLELPSLIELEDVSIEIPVLDYRNPEITYTIDLFQRAGGELKVSGLLNWEEELNFNRFDLTEWTLKPYQNYLTSYLKINHFDAKFFGSFMFGGNYGSTGYVATSGNAEIRDFELVDTNADSLLILKRVRLVVDSVNTGENLYDIRTLQLDNPSVEFKYYEATDNFTSLYMDTLSQETLDTVQVNQQEIVFENPFQYVSDYLRYFINKDILNTFEIDSAGIKGGYVHFQDYSQLEDAVIVLDHLDIKLDGVLREDSIMSMNFAAMVNKTGEMYGNLNLDRLTLSDIAFNFEIQNFFISAFDPYSKHFTAHPLWEGNLNLSSSTSVQNRQLSSNNHLLILQPEVGKKLDIETEYNVPLRFAFGLLKDVEGNVELDLPIEGNLDDPDYQVGKVIIKVIMNVLSKAVASPYKLLARAFDADEEDMKSITFDPNQDSLAAAQLKSLNLLVRVLENKEDLKANLEYAMNEKEEKDALALRQVKGQFLESLPDSLKGKYSGVTAVDNTDSLFISFLNQKTQGLGTMTVAEMSRSVVGEDILSARCEELQEIHKRLLSTYLFEKSELSEERVAITDSKDPGKISSILRPTFFIEYGVLDYTAPDSIAGPETPANLAIPPKTDGDSSPIE